MQEVVAGIFHWTAHHERIDKDVSSYYLVAERVLLDPMTPAEGVAWFQDKGAPAQIVLTNRHHYRHSASFVEAFGCTVWCNRHGMHELEGRQDVEPFDAGDELPGGVLTREVGAICPDETALHMPALRALACADGLVRMAGDGPVGFVPDHLLGDDPDSVKAGLIHAYRGLLDLDFEHLLLAHGNPLVADGKAALGRFVEAFEG